MDPGLGGAEGQTGEEEDDGEQDPRESRGVAHLEELEALVVKHEAIEISRLERTSLGDDECTGKVLEGVDHLHDEVEQDDRGEFGDGDLPEDAHPPRPIYARSLILADGYLFQSCQKEQHGRAELPNGDQTDGSQCIAGIAQPIHGLDAEDAYKVVHHPLVHKQVLPQYADGDAAAEDGWYVVEGTKQVDTLDVLIQDDRYDQGEGDLERDGDQDIV
ncbi:hypothetical protein SDC9_59198 [bioreactor metagenome]|uniref:Uncharacterized protein n=1 Tax=bioreactor metagenome TaxID=1076179 RepID=A0A644XFC6_9ZZZZ